MNELIKQIYIGLFILSLFVYISKLHLLIDKKYIYIDSKYILILLATMVITYSIYYDNKYINQYILPLLLFLNVGILLFIDTNYRPSNLHILSMVGIVYLLAIFNYKDFRINKGVLVNPNKSWIYQYVIILTIWYITMNKKPSRPNFAWKNSLLIIYPLLFPIEEYFIHRAYSLVVYIAINMYYLKRWN